MAEYISRSIQRKVLQSLEEYPVVALLGPHQSGRSTLANQMDGLYLNLERLGQRRKLRDAQRFLEQNESSLICLDGVHLLPELLPLIGSIVDERERKGQFLLLGDISTDFLKPLSGRMVCLEMTPFLISEVPAEDVEKLWLRGGLPESYLGQKSFEWREGHIQTFLERGRKVEPRRMEQLWSTLARTQGQTLNSSQLSQSIGISSHTVNSYLHRLEQAFLIRTLQPYSGQLKKRLTKSPKIYIRDSGILHALLGIETMDDLRVHPLCERSFEGLVIEQIIAHFPRWNHSFYQTRSGAAIDLIMSRNQQTMAINITTDSSPTPPRGFREAIKDIAGQQNYIIAPVASTYSAKGNITVTNLKSFLLEGV